MTLKLLTCRFGNGGVENERACNPMDSDLIAKFELITNFSHQSLNGAAAYGRVLVLFG